MRTRTTIAMSIMAHLLALCLVGCGNNKADGESTLRVVTDTIKCDQATPNVCSSDRMSCVRVNYYSDEWKCTLVLEKE